MKWTFLSILKIGLFTIIFAYSFVYYELDSACLRKTLTYFDKPISYNTSWSSIDSRPLPEWYDKSKIGILLYWSSVKPAFNVPDEIIKTHSVKNPRRQIESYLGQRFKPLEITNLVKKSGAKYVLISAKSYDGISLWHSSYSNGLNTYNLKPHMNIVSMVANAVRKWTDLKFGIYYSLFEANKVLVKEISVNGTKNTYVHRKVMPELYELVDQYLPEVIWVDGESMMRDTFWESKTFLSWLYSISGVAQTVVVNDRWGLNTICKHGGFYTCRDGHFTKNDTRHKWEHILEIPKFTDEEEEGEEDVRNSLNDLITSIFEIATVISYGGNILIQVDLDPHGAINFKTKRYLENIGEWLLINGEAIYNTTSWVYTLSLDSKSTKAIDSSGSLESVYRSGPRIAEVLRYCYTTRPDLEIVYIIINWPASNQLRINYDNLLFINSQVGKTHLFLLDKFEMELSWVVEDSKRIVINMPEKKSLFSKWCWTLKIVSPSYKAAYRNIQQMDV